MGVINTSRLKIAPWTEAQAAAFFELSNDDGFNSYPITKYRQPDLSSARSWINGAAALYQKTRLGKLAIWEIATDTLVGMGGLTPWSLEGEELVDLTYRFKRSAWGQGYGTEAATALVKYAFDELHLPMITATITPDNIPSKKVAEKLGMKFDKRILLLGVETDLYRLRDESRGK